MPALDTDITNEAAAVAVEGLVRERFEDRGYVLTRIGKSPKRANIFRTNAPFAKITAGLIAPNGDKTQRIELLCDGQQLALFGEHPDTHRPYGWFGGEPGQTPAAALPYSSAEEGHASLRMPPSCFVLNSGYSLPAAAGASAAGAAPGQGQPPPGHDWATLLGTIASQSGGLHDALCIVAAKLAARGITGGEAEAVLFALMDSAGCPRHPKWAEYRADIPRAVRTAGQFAKPGAAPWDEPDDSAMFDRRGILPELPLDLLPTNLARWAKEAAEATGTTPAHVILPALGIASGLIGTARVVRASDTYAQPIAMWTMLVGPSAIGKTPALRASKSALDGVAKELAAQNEDEKKQHDAKVATSEALLGAWKSAIKAADKAGEPHPPMPAGAEAPGMFVPATAYVTDATIEKIVILHTAATRTVARRWTSSQVCFRTTEGTAKGATSNFGWLRTTPAATALTASGAIQSTSRA